MSFLDIVDVCSDEEDGEAQVNFVKQKNDPISDMLQHRGHPMAANSQSQKFKENVNGSVNAGCSRRTLDQDNPVGDVLGATSIPVECSAPICRQFWKAGDYEVGHASKISLPNGKNHLRVHPKFLHSNATSHKWAFGAIAELLDNAVDEIQNGATFVIVDKISNPRNGSPALLIQDNGGGMDPACLRRCMSFGFSEKSKSMIGKYGNGFKTSTMRLGADAIVFCCCMRGRMLTQSVGLLSYTFLMLTGHADIVIPMVDYEFDPSTGVLKTILFPDEEHFYMNLSTLLQWSPYATEAELLKQFDDIGHHGTKVIVFNLWSNDDGDMELDFESDKEDIEITGALHFHKSALTQDHIANRFRHSLRAYLSILYLRTAKNFRIILRGQVVEHHNIADDLKYIEYILYKPQAGGNMEPFWRVVQSNNGIGRGVVGVLEANFVEPTHDKQDFEWTSLFQKLKIRLREMTVEYWDLHCGLIGYRHKSRRSVPSPGTLRPVVVNHNSPTNYIQGAPMPSSSVVVNTLHATNFPNSLFMPEVEMHSPQGLSFGHDHTGSQSVQRPVVTALHIPNVWNAATMSPTAPCTPGHSSGSSQTGSQWESYSRRKQPSHVEASGSMKRRATACLSNHDHEETVGSSDEALLIMQQNEKLRALCIEYEKTEEELQLKVQWLKNELQEVNLKYERLLTAMK
ncbi:protein MICRORCHIDIA 6-like isoform X2 [Magnolia sinica]|uniref:protein MICRORCHIDIA 6-like isoform X2 n=1 Tax=Magnolia sinica TaxID=86752 RepID=UPI002658436A|nr:protein MICRORCHIDIA 6-like isoform X2 [Magnolia sinica]